MTHRTCTVVDCERPHKSRGMCGMHYQRHYSRNREQIVTPYRCSRCRGEIVGRGSASKFCTPCAKVNRAESTKRWRDANLGYESDWRARNPEKAEARDLRERKRAKQRALPCPVVVDGVPCATGQRTLGGKCYYHHKQAQAGLPFTAHRRRRTSRQVLERDAEGRKLCTHCSEWLPTTDFRPNSVAVDALQAWCSLCSSEGRRFARYGIDGATFDAMLSVQGGCAICHTSDPGASDARGLWHVDHDHSCCPPNGNRSDATCGECVRAILCARCNKMIGHAGDDVTLLGAAIRYIGTYQR